MRHPIPCLIDTFDAGTGCSTSSTSGSSSDVHRSLPPTFVVLTHFHPGLVRQEPPREQLPQGQLITGGVGKVKTERGSSLKGKGKGRSEIPLYTTPVMPSGEISTDIILRWCKERQEVLKQNQDQYSRDQFSPNKEGISTLSMVLMKQTSSEHDELECIVLGKSERDPTGVADVVSHWMLKLAMAADEDLMKIHCRREMDLLFSRIDNKTNAHIRPNTQALFDELVTAIPDFRTKLQVLSASDLKKIPGCYQYLTACGLVTRGAEPIYALSDCFAYPSLMLTDKSGRRSIPYQGTLYVGPTALKKVAMELYTSAFTADLESLQRCREAINKAKDRRVLGILDALEHAETGLDRAEEAAAGSLTIRTIGEQSRLFPPCMAAIHHHLNGKYTLKHQGRLQFWSYLRACGMPVEDVASYTQRAMAKGGKTQEEWQKQYMYALRHVYGLEGKRQKMEPWGCRTIIAKGAPQSAAGECHGCPFRYLPAKAILPQALQKWYGLKSGDIEDVVTTAGKDHYEVACVKFWHVLHKKRGDASVTGPVTFYTEALEDK
ncbi:DNA primase large subunit, eukaryotic/archaeal [Kipferlia bialata]|uniref:DNA primase large subunit, eukaryotic/archaeal n=1 Tax=Kipferlia bialata TaxID=797122 RepID=A0A9K3GEA8_9EUKA|nr:DNA primase large subunit, eukaryotic/archaeal [Kipferlia bialata]|eukprot:g1663.t1